MAGIKTIAQGRSDTFRLRVADLVVKAGWNVRNLETPEAQEKLEILARSIAENGIKEPLTVVMEDSKPVITNGHRRHKAALLAIEKFGADPNILAPVVTEDRSSTEADHVFSMIVRNQGEPLTPMEQGSVFARLVDLGWTVAAISTKSGFSRVYVANLIELASAPEELTKLVEEGAVSSTLAIGEIKAAKGDTEKAAEVLKGAVKEAEKEGKTRATAKHVRRSAPEIGDAEPDEKPAKEASDNPGKKLQAQALLSDLRKIVKRVDTHRVDSETIALHFSQSQFVQFCELIGLDKKVDGQ